MARLPKVRLRAIPVFPTNVSGDNGIEVTKANGQFTVGLDVSDFQIAAVETEDADATYAISWGRVTDDNPTGQFQLVPYSQFISAADDISSLLGETGVVVRNGAGDFTASATLAASRGGFGADISAASGVPLFATGTATFTGTSGTGNFARVTNPTFTAAITVTTNVASSTFNNVSIVAPASTAVLSVGSGKTVGLANSMTIQALADGGTYTLPATSATIARTDAAQTFTGAQTFSTPVALASGGTAANLTASNGGIFYSTASAGAILSGTATARQMLQSGASAAPSWSTTTWPATTTVNRLLYSSAANVISDLATANSAVLVTNGSGVPSLSTTLPNIALGTPTSVTLTNGTGLPISSGLTGAGTGVLAALAVNVGSAGAPVLFNGAGGTPSSITLTNGTGLPIASGVSGLGTGVATFLATPSSANLAAALTDESGSGSVAFGTVAATATASTIAARDANANLSANSFLTGYTTTATAAGTTTLTVSSTQQQFFTGTTTQTVALPVASTLVLGQYWIIHNNSTGLVTVQSSGANTVVVVPPGQRAVVTCILTSGTSAASWSAVLMVEGAAWLTYTPTVTSQGGTPTTTAAAGRYKWLTSKTLVVSITVTVTDRGTATGAVRATLPFSSLTTFSYAGSAYEYIVTGKGGTAVILGGTPTYVSLVDSTGGSFWTNGYGVTATFIYEIP